MLDIDFDYSFIEKLAVVICGDEYSDKFCEDISPTKCPVYRTKPQLEKFFKILWILNLVMGNLEKYLQFSVCLK